VRRFINRSNGILTLLPRSVLAGPATHRAVHPSQRVRASCQLRQKYSGWYCRFDPNGDLGAATDIKRDRGAVGFPSVPTNARLLEVRHQRS